MRHIGATLLAALLTLAPGPAGAAMSAPVEITCPVGGERFTFTDTPSYSTWGTRPDGKPFGSWDFPLPIPECPGNGLVLYKDFSPAEIKRLRQIADQPGYRALRGETTYYRAAWLTRELEGGGLEAAWRLLQASWQADGAPERKARYQREFVEAAAALPAAPDSLDWLALQGRAANALRELGEFDRAARLLAGLPPRPLDRPGADTAGWRAYFDKLAAAVARRDARPAPPDMVPAAEAALLCLQAAERPGSPRDPHCATAEVQGEILRLRAAAGLEP
ncbi:MAG TPA: hypothetical protein VED40_21125 [Azospirillaceae bacterium]|nr:hypothetical protein [Azospirillaceae bacterium]